MRPAAAVVVSGPTYTNKWLFTTRSGSVPTLFSDSVTLLTSNGSYSGASSDVVDNVNGRSSLSLKTPRSLSLPNLTYTSNGCTLTFRVRMTSIRNNTYNILGQFNTAQCFNATNGNMYVSYNTGGTVKTASLWVGSAGTGNISIPAVGTTNWMYVALIFGRNISTGTLDHTSFSYVQDYSSGTFSGSNLGLTTSQLIRTGLTFSAGQTLSGTDMFTSYTAGNQLDGEAICAISDVRFVNSALTAAQLQTEYLT